MSFSDHSRLQRAAAAEQMKRQQQQQPFYIQATHFRRKKQARTKRPKGRKQQKTSEREKIEYLHSQ